MHVMAGVIRRSRNCINISISRVNNQPKSQTNKIELVYAEF